jgi:hypothetical protein
MVVVFELLWLDPLHDRHSIFHEASNKSNMQPIPHFSKLPFAMKPSTRIQQAFRRHIFHTLPRALIKFSFPIVFVTISRHTE